jgi:hypothetical protein
MTNFTCDDLLKYVYKQTAPATNRAIEEALMNDWTLREKFEVIKSAHNALDTVKLSSPRQSSVDAIMQYAASSTTEAVH